ncbi:hypothetical protein F5X99DRAFT_368760 [Biscogniauxia marginata]|nr:hypothetical protein F5X99DRAFT_368760 [Biscogniauxia marginata]
MADVPFQPKGLAAATFGITLTLCVVSTITVGLRVMVRLGNKALGVDDYLMITGLAFFEACATFAMMDTFSGLGTKDVDILAVSPDGKMMMYGYKWFFFFQVTYVWTLPFIKASICVALLRITDAKHYVYPLWGIIIISVGTAFAGFVGALLNCRPIAAGWDASLGSCDSSGRIQTLSEVISAAAIVTDWACAIVPAFLIYGLNMKRKQKLTLCGILALGVVASISTIVRFPWLQAYGDPVNQLYNFGQIVLWTQVECGLGIIAGSLPSLRPLLRRIGFTSTKSYSHQGADSSQPGGRSIHLNQIRGQSTATCQGGGDEAWERLDDSSSQKFIIMKNTQVDVKWSEQSN